MMTTSSRFFHSHCYFQIGILLALIFFGSVSLVAQLRIENIQFDFLKKTKQSYLQNIMVSQAGALLDTNQLAEDFQQLRNLDIFYDLEYTIEKTPNGAEVTFSGKEKITLLPIVNLGVIEENFWFRLGAFDANFRGNGEFFGAYYTYYDRHSFNIFYKNPFLGGSRWGTEIFLQKLSTREPVFQRDIEAIYHYDNWTAEGLISYWFNIKNRVKFGAAYLRERYFKVSDPSLSEGLPGFLELSKWIFKSKYEWGQINFFANLVSGIDNQAFFETVLTTDTQEFFWKYLNVFRAFKRYGKRGNLGMRIRFGLSGQTESPFVPFVLDSYINIRGSGNRVARGIGELVGNFEIRHNLREWHWGAFQGVLFWDVGNWRLAGEPIGNIVSTKHLQSFIGIGGRIYLKRFYNMILRADFGFDTLNKGSNGIVLGLGQYF